MDGVTPQDREHRSYRDPGRRSGIDPLQGTQSGWPHVGTSAGARPKVEGRHVPLWSALLLILLLSILIIACGTQNPSQTADLNGPQATVTISFAENAATMPPVAPYLCGAWVTNTTPVFRPGNQIPVYAHFIHNVNGNPVGISGASAQATVEWADGSRNSEITSTTSDGLAVFFFTIPNHPGMVNRNNLVTVSFTGPNGETCNADNQPQPAAFFTLVTGSMPSPTSNASSSQASPAPKKKRKKH